MNKTLAIIMNNISKILMNFLIEEISHLDSSNFFSSCLNELMQRIRSWNKGEHKQATHNRWCQKSLNVNEEFMKSCSSLSVVLLGCRKSHYHVRVLKIWIFITLGEMRVNLLPCSHHLNSIWGSERWAGSIYHLSQSHTIFCIMQLHAENFWHLPMGWTQEVPFKNHQY